MMSNLAARVLAERRPLFRRFGDAHAAHSGKEKWGEGGGGEFSDFLPVKPAALGAVGSFRPPPAEVDWEPCAEEGCP